MKDYLYGAFLGLVITVPLALVVLAYVLAQSKIFFTMPKEAKAEFVMAGNAAKRMILVWKSHKVEQDFKIAEGNRATKEMLLHFCNPRNWLEPLGIYWVGLWPFYKIYTYDFVWTEEKTENGKIVPFTRHATRHDPEGQTSFIKVNDTNYFVVANDVKTDGGVPLKFTLLISVRIENPYKALFSGEEWLERLAGAVSNMTVRYAGVLPYEDITASKPATIVVGTGTDGRPKTETKTLEELLILLGDGKHDDACGADVDLLEKYGVHIIAAKIHSIDFADDDAAKQYREATTQKYVAEQRGLGEAAEAEGHAQAVRTRADAEQYRINKLYEPIAGDNKEARMEIRRLEALERSGEKGGNTVVIPDTLVGLAKVFTRK